MSNQSLKIIFAGTPEIAADCLDAVLHSTHQVVGVYTQPDRPKGRGQSLTASPVKDVALKNNIPVYQPQTLRDEKVQNELKNLNADIMVVVAYGLILPKAVLTATPLGCINVHASLLPRWRGAAPIQRAILSGDDTSGVTIMQMDEGLDTGPMLLKKECAIDKHETSATLYKKLTDLGKSALIAVLDNIHNLVPEVQDNALATYAAKINKEEAEINWQHSAIEIERQIRAFNPSPVAYTFINSEPIRCWRALADDENAVWESGTIISATKEGIVVGTGQGKLLLEEIQLPGSKKLPVKDILNSKRDMFLPHKKLGRSS